jgi:hypothetical protein
MVHAWEEDTRAAYGAGLLMWHCFCDDKGILEEERAPANQTHNVAKFCRYTCKSPCANRANVSVKPMWAHQVRVGVYHDWAHESNRRRYQMGPVMPTCDTAGWANCRSCEVLPIDYSGPTIMRYRKSRVGPSSTQPRPWIILAIVSDGFSFTFE